MSDETWLREQLAELEQIHRPSASEGERCAAEWIVERFGELDAEARIEAEQPALYHWPNDVAENVEFGTVADGIRLVEAAIRRLDERWLN